MPTVITFREIEQLPFFEQALLFEQFYRKEEFFVSESLEKPGLFHKRVKFLRRIGVVGRLYGAVFFAPVIEGTERNVELLAEYIQSGTLFISADDFLFEGRCVFFWHDRLSLNICRYHPETCRVWMKKPPSTKRDGGSGLFS